LTTFGLFSDDIRTTSGAFSDDIRATLPPARGLTAGAAPVIAVIDAGRALAA
jgi:hypothetical protein